MSGHLTEREIIEYQFKLVSAVRLDEIREHLNKCSGCRHRAEELQRKFAALDLLRDEAEVSEELISQAAAQGAQPAGRRFFPLGRSAWIGAAAAVLLVVGLLLIPYFAKDATEKRNFAKAPKPFAEAEGIEAGAKEELAAPRDGLAGLGREVSAKMIPEEPPFAPASAIELVTLPRRESVQLTIYNSTFAKRSIGYGYGGGSGYGGHQYSGERQAVQQAESDESVRRQIERLQERAARRYDSSGQVPGGDLTLVRERRNLTLKRGWNWLQFMWANTLIDPTSLSLEPLEQADKIDIEQLVFPARLREVGRWLIRSEVSGKVPFEITYFTIGLTWRAFYMGTLGADEKTMRLQGYVRVTNGSGEDYENAQTRLIVGRVHLLDRIAELAKRKYPYDRPGIVQGYEYGRGGLGGRRPVDKLGDGDVILMDKMSVRALYSGLGLAEDLRRKEIKKEGLSEYFLYTIEGTETIPDKWGKRLLSFDVKDITVKSLYKYDEERWGEQTIRFVTFANDEEHNLGETPIPDGQVKIYAQANEQGHLSYVGWTNVKYIPVDEEVELNLGSARLVSVEPVLMDFKTDNYVFDRKGNIAGWDEIRTWKIEITNTRDLPVELEITRVFDTPYWTLQFDEKEVSYEKHDAEHARFKRELQARRKRAFGYTVTTYHGRREEALTEKDGYKTERKF